MPASNTLSSWLCGGQRPSQNKLNSSGGNQIGHGGGHTTRQAAPAIPYGLDQPQGDSPASTAMLTMATRSQSNASNSSFTLSPVTPMVSQNEAMKSAPMPTPDEIRKLFATDGARGQIVPQPVPDLTDIDQLLQRGQARQAPPDASALPDSLDHPDKPASDDAVPDGSTGNPWYVDDDEEILLSPSASPEPRGRAGHETSITASPAAGDLGDSHHSHTTTTKTTRSHYQSNPRGPNRPADRVHARRHHRSSAAARHETASRPSPSADESYPSFTGDRVAVQGIHPAKRHRVGGHHSISHEQAAPDTTMGQHEYRTIGMPPVPSGYQTSSLRGPTRPGVHAISAPVDHDEEKELFKQTFISSLVQRVNELIKDDMLAQGALTCNFTQLCSVNNDDFTKAVNKWCDEGWVRDLDRSR